MTQSQALRPNLPTLIPAKLTLKQYHQIVDSGALDQSHIELLNGKLVQMPAAII